MCDECVPPKDPFDDEPRPPRGPDLDPRDKPRPRPRPFPVDPDPRIYPRDDLGEAPTG